MKVNSNYDYEWITNPGIIGGFLKRHHALRERPIPLYNLLGWDASGMLWHSKKADGYEKIMSYDPEFKRLDVHDKAPDDLYTRLCNNVDLNNLILKPNVGGETKYQWITSDELRLNTDTAFYKDRFFSHDCNWYAVVLSQPYGPDDIVIIDVSSE